MATSTDGVTLLIGTSKGGFVLNGSADRSSFGISQPIMLGNKIHHMVADPRNREDWLIAARTGHLGPTVFRSHDRGETWKEASQPPAFPKAPEGEEGKSVKTVFWLTPGHANQPGIWFAGTSPIGLWRSSDRGENWSAVDGFNQHARYDEWSKGGDVPDINQTVHSIVIDPRDPNHMYFGISVGGVFETTNGGEDWRCLNQGVAADFIPFPDPEWGHDPHCMVIHPSNPDRLYQQNHCGIYRLDRPGDRWERIGDNMPKEIGDVGFAIATHPRNPDVLWVFPMDAATVWPRTAPHGKPAIYKSSDGGRSWKRCDSGWPKSDAYFHAKRQCMAHDHSEPLGVYVGTSNGEIWASRDEGESWNRIASNLPPVISVEVA